MFNPVSPIKKNATRRYVKVYKVERDYVGVDPKSRKNIIEEYTREMTRSEGNICIKLEPLFDCAKEFPAWLPVLLRGHM